MTLNAFMNQEPYSTRWALKLWHEVSLSLVLDSNRDLTQRQMAILLKVYLEPPPHTVRKLASDLSVTKPVITRALDTLGKMGLLDRRRDDADHRNVVIQRTVEGSIFLDNLGGMICEKAKGIPS